MTDSNPAPQASESGPAPIPAIVPAAGSLKDYVSNWIARVRAGDTGALPVIAGLIIIAVIFQSLNGNFLTPGNLVNLMVQGSVYMLFSLGMIFILLLGEIDLSIGFIDEAVQAGIVSVTRLELLGRHALLEFLLDRIPEVVFLARDLGIGTARLLQRGRRLVGVVRRQERRRLGGLATDRIGRRRRLAGGIDDLFRGLRIDALGFQPRLDRSRIN